MNQPHAPQSGQKQSRNARRRQQGKRPAAVDVWRAPAELPPVDKIAEPTDVGALLRSLGDPPIGNGTAAGHYFNAVVERAAAVALALAVSADLLSTDD